jgi:UDP-N-acetylglucosamine--N-acetylmuramyl-(pentapeptide) pyrophosphoryl-undecaprenol N-acetylglucosamine transferase
VIRARGPTVLLAGGGTGGHLFPGVAVAEHLCRRRAGTRVLLACTRKDHHSEHGAACPLERVQIDSPRRPARIVGLPAFGARMAGALGRSLRLLRDERPDVVIGLGGYGSVAPVLAARLVGVPVLLLEQNAVPGRATQLLSRAATVTAASFPGLPRVGGRIVITGNPLRAGVLDTRLAHEEFGLAPGLPVLGVIGGSLGARGLNDRVAAALPALARGIATRFSRSSIIVARHPESVRPVAPFQVMHAAGTAAESERLEAVYRQNGVRACVRPFFRDMGAVYGTCDVLLCRAGGTTVAELTALGLTAIFVPYPHHRDDHQVENARPMIESGAAELVREDALEPATLCEKITPLLLDAALRARRGRAARRLGRPDAAERVVDLVEELIGQVPGPSPIMRANDRVRLLGEVRA